jgi:hypothetical protein
MSTAGELPNDTHPPFAKRGVTLRGKSAAGSARRDICYSEVVLPESLG